MGSSFPLLSFESSVSLKESPDRNILYCTHNKDKKAAVRAVVDISVFSDFQLVFCLLGNL